jgi:hypothetical protein
MLWAQLLARIYEVVPLLCPVCGGGMRIISCITLPATIERILLQLRAGGSDEGGLAALVEADHAALTFGAEALEWGRFRFDGRELADLRARTLGGFGSCSLREPVDELGGGAGWRRNTRLTHRSRSPP